MRDDYADLLAQGIYIASGLPVVGDVIDLYYGYKRTSDYLRNTGMSWSDIEYFGSGMTGAHGVGSLFNFVSSNIERLYK